MQYILDQIEEYGIRNFKKSLGINRIEDILTVQEGIELMNQITETKEELSKYNNCKMAFQKGDFKIDTTITKDQYELAINGYIEEIDELIQECLSEADLSPNDIEIVVLSGGSSLTPAVKNLLRNKFGANKIQIDGSAMTAVSRGLALRGHDPILNKYNDILEHNYGIGMKDGLGREEIVRVVLEKGIKILDIGDESHYKEFELTESGRSKNAFKVTIYENNEIIADAYVPLSEEMLNSNFKLYFTIDENNERLELHVYDLTWDKMVEVPMEYRFIEIEK